MKWTLLHKTPMRFFRHFLAHLLLALCAIGVPGQAVDSGQKNEAAKEGKAWQGKLDGTPLTQKRLEELLAAHKAWVQTVNKRLKEERKEAIPQLRGVLASDPALDREADEGRLILRKASLGEVHLKGANLWGAYLEGVLYEAKLGALPDIVSLKSAEHLETMRFEESPHALEELRQAFKQAGMRQQEREITYAIKRSEQQNAWKDGNYIESLFNFIVFDLPVGYGLYPVRALWILAALILVFALFYGWAIKMPSQSHSIYRLWPEGRIEVAENGAEVANDAKTEQLDARGWRVVTYALYFSLLSAFHIGWRELNVGNWITRLQRHPYTLQATGWIRTVSGLQSLISVYLLAMWVLTYFGRGLLNKFIPLMRFVDR